MRAPEKGRGVRARRVRTSLAVLLAATAVAATGASAQEGGAVLTLDSALRLAEGSNPGYRRATNDVLLNGVEMRTTWLESLLPTASLTLFTNFRGNLQRTSRDNFGNPIANPTADWRYFSNTTQALSVNWNVQGLSLFQRHKRQSLTNRQRDLALGSSLTDLQVRVRLLYMDALEQLELRESEAQLLEARRIDLDVAERLFSLALRSRVDVLTAELAVEQQALALQQQDATYRTALLELRTALGTGDDRPFDVVDVGLPIFDPTALDAEALVDRALDLNPTLRESSLALESSSHAVAEQRNGWWPTVEFGFDVYRRVQADAGRALFDPAFDQDLESQFFMQMSVPVFNDFFGTRQAAQQATIQLRNDRETDRERRLDVEKDVRGAVLALSNQWASLRYAERSGEIAAETVRLAREEYRLGTGSFEELRRAFDDEAATRRQVITSRHAFVEALLRLEEAIGSEVRPPETGAPSPGSEDPGGLAGAPGAR